MQSGRWLVVLLTVASAGCGTGARALVGPARPCTDSGGASPFADAEHEQAAAFPHDGERVRVRLHVGEHFTAGWSGCGEHGRITTTPDDGTGPITTTDVGVYSSPRPAPTLDSRGPCCPRPPADAVFTVRYVAQRPGEQVLHGQGSAGSDGDIDVVVSAPSG